MVYGRSPGNWIGVAALLAMAVPSPASAQDRASITGLGDLAFGTIVSPIDQSKTQNVSICSYFSLFGFPLVVRNYSVTATGTGSGGAFTLSSGARTLAYDVQWTDAINATSGTMLQPGVASSGFGNNANSLLCRQGSQDNASLIVTIRATQLAIATAGTYSGTLQIMISPD
jgi:hypothetical protein